MCLKTYCWVGLGGYAALSVADFFLTFSLLRVNEEAFESNPIAAAWLEGHDWLGLAMFKAITVAVFSVAVYLIASRRPAVAASVVTLGCAVLLAVTTYSHGLLVESRAEAAERATDAAGSNKNQLPKPDDVGDAIASLFAIR